MRLHKAIADAGFASRRAAEELIRGGKVSVNGEVVTEMGVMVDPNTDRISIDGTTLGKADRKRTYIFYKPLGVLCTRDDPHGRSTVFDVLPDEVGAGLHTAGRLDMDAEGLLILTNDGDLTLTLTHPSSHLSKTYLVKVKGEVLLTSLKKLRRGVELEDGMTLPASISVIKGKGTERNTWLRIVLREGKKNQIKRMCEAVGHRVLSIKRISIGGMALPDKMKPGSFKKLSKKEIETLLGGRDRIVQSPMSKVQRGKPQPEPMDQGDEGTRGRGVIITQRPKTKDQREEPETKPAPRSWKPKEGWAVKSPKPKGTRGRPEKSTRRGDPETPFEKLRAGSGRGERAGQNPSGVAPRAIAGRKSKDQRGKPEPGSTTRSGRSDTGEKGRRASQPSSRLVRDHSSAGKKTPFRTKRTPRS
ncbi:MAG: pseudouridine synthase [bacterium]|nr:pseudouridine synthase [bacterium]MDT8367069.1 pseudouridine synthase [bacterium]